ncbi:hypothetical protein [Gleimia hominis]|uniref:hypothetical protein n=1 Tax=Gleimia hominis TaxID=595468 RepID=UPI000C7F9E8A|nr:hypothetical protein [Gleimia hominis]WIK64430.1 hypothetical protein CJ187_009050 [Gleimia hominis]
MGKKIGIVIACGAFGGLTYAIEAGLGIDLHPTTSNGLLDDHFSLTGFAIWVGVGLAVGIVGIIIKEFKNRKDH